MVKQAGDYAWSSYQHNAFGLPDPLITPHAQYESLGKIEVHRQIAYQALFQKEIAAGLLSSIRETSNKNGILGGENYIAKIQSIVGRSLLPKAKGGDRRSKQYKINRL